MSDKTKNKKIIEQMIRKEQFMQNTPQIKPEQGLIDMSAYLLPKMGFKGVKSIPVVNTAVKKYIPDPKIWRQTRKMKNKIFNTGVIGGSAAAVGDEFGLFNYLKNINK